MLSQKDLLLMVVFLSAEAFPAKIHSFTIRLVSRCSPTSRVY
jgi:hypothetical protein